ncbi:MAG: alpha-glucosidase/alpha-galactosidase, partial [Candidatus Sumerlaeota bacterium]|nr:alpha-glucosidase/alpha-galactosidase [Candidatus Sumerlaeota bacterium]
NFPNPNKGEKVRCEIFKQFGYFCTESSGHDSEYLPYFRKNEAALAEFGLQKRNVAGLPARQREWSKDTGVVDDENAPVGELKRSHEYTTSIMEAMLTNVPFRFNGNVMNHGLISNLPEGCCVEVPCFVDSLGVHPTAIGALPPHLAALDRTNVAVQELAVKAVLERDREAAFQACALDPLAAAACTLSQIRRMFDEMWEAEKDLLRWFDPSHKGRLAETCAP